MDRPSVSGCVAALFALSACASAAGTKPYDMSETQHEAAAAQEQQVAQGHAQQYSPTAREKQLNCDPRGRACWTSVTNPTARHTTDAAEHEKLAGQHRAAAQALRDAEANVCAGIDETDRATSPFYHREDIVQVSEAQRAVPAGLHPQTAFGGGRAVFRAVPGLTAEWLQRLVNCHVARAAAVGFVMPEMDYCPLMLKGVEAKVSSVGDGFAIDVTSDDSQTASEIWRRMQGLKP